MTDRSPRSPEAKVGSVGPAGLAVVVVMLAAGLVAAACGTASEPSTGSEPAAAAPSLAGYERSPAPNVGDRSLPAVNRDGAEFAFRADDGELLLVYFGFTNCPDFCPTTLADTRIALTELGPLAARVDLAFVTVDPGRDTAEAQSSYVEAFIPDGIALRTEDETLLRDTAFAFGADYRIETDDDGDIEVGHTTTLFAVDDTGTLVLTWPFGVTTDDIANDLAILLDRIDNGATTTSDSAAGEGATSHTAATNTTTSERATSDTAATEGAR